MHLRLREVVRLSVMISLVVGWFAAPGASPALAQKSAMEARLDQLLHVLVGGQSCEAADRALSLLPEALWGGMRPVVSKDLLAETRRAHGMATEMEGRVASVLETFAASGRCGDLGAQALDLKLFVEQISEVAEAAGQVTARCGAGDSLAEPPCDELVAVLDEETGHEGAAGILVAPATDGEMEGDRMTAQPVRPVQPVRVLRPPYSVKLRGPVVPPWLSGPQEDIRVTDPIADGECVVIFKEFKGLMLRLKLDRIIVVSDPWVTFYGVPRGTRVPIWRLEWIFSEYVKEWNICNHKGRVVKTVTQRVKQDVPLNYFWRFYPKDP